MCHHLFHRTGQISSRFTPFRFQFHWHNRLYQFCTDPTVKDTLFEITSIRGKCHSDISQCRSRVSLERCILVWQSFWNLSLSSFDTMCIYGCFFSVQCRQLEQYDKTTMTTSRVKIHTGLHCKFFCSLSKCHLQTIVLSLFWCRRRSPHFIGGVFAYLWNEFYR